MRLFFVFLFFVIATSLFPQFDKVNNALRMQLAEKSMPGTLYSLLVQGDMQKLISAAKEKNFTLHYYAGDIASITCDVGALSYLIEKKIVLYAELVQHHVQPMNDTMVVRNRIKGVKTGAAPLSQAYDGSGILIGIIDTGIDVDHGDFKDVSGNSRIKFLWDQVPNGGSTIPSPFNYGIEWTDAQIDANQCTHLDMAHFGHGTHVAGIAAGNGLANGTHEGCAPKADIIMVAVDFNKTGPVTADAVQYIINKATQLGKPCVINASLGDYYGSHDATDLEAKVIENMVKNIPGRVLVAAAGNGGKTKFHVKTQPSGNDTAWTWLHTNGPTLEYWFYGDTGQVKNLQISVGVNRNNYFSLGRIPFNNSTYGSSSVKHDTLKYNGNRIGIIHNSSSINSSGVYELYLKIDADTSGYLWRVETKGSGVHHAWNFSFLSNNLPTLSQYPAFAHYLIPDTLYSMVSSYQCSDEIITVANYANVESYFDFNDTLRHTGTPAGAIGPSSSTGPTRDGRQKPDIAATGHTTFSSLVTGMQASQIANNPKSVAPGGKHGNGGGTSASAPVVSGLVALYLQAHPNATNQQIKTAIINCAYTDAFTTSNVPNYAWGYGKLDGKATMTCGENLVSIKENNSNADLRYFPNPFKNKVTFELTEKTDGTIYVYSTEGKLLYKDQVLNGRYELFSSQIQGNNPSLLFVRITTANGTYAIKLVKE